TRSVEKAQTKVENMHYESRKHILEYDDIANQQRKSIYSFRNQLLDPEYDIDSKIRENRIVYVDYLLSESDIYDGTPTEDFDLDRLKELLNTELAIDFDKEIFEGKDYNDIKTALTNILEQGYEEKMAPLSPEQRSEVQRVLYLQVLDPQWRDHLYEMDVLKTGIGLRGYNQKDPLTEYKKDSYNLFMQLIERIKIEAVKTLQLVQFNFESPEEEQQKMEEILDELESDLENAVTNEEDMVQADVEEGDAPALKPIRTANKPKRNDPCPCGSGKKYKQCCGKSGPKKGILA
ncbi:MAG: SEC-C domain-containing protein, partial [Sulfurovaceae bacterium]|nr:SEC-C domain-containing protein [Sulfurovaceae bacterium]